MVVTFQIYSATSARSPCILFIPKGESVYKTASYEVTTRERTREFPEGGVLACMGVGIRRRRAPH